MALSNLDAQGNLRYLGMIATYLTGRQNSNGSWDYNGRNHGDSSISQYAVLGLWEAENAGVSVTPAVWDRAAGWFMATQHSSGAWSYHSDEIQYQETLSMTAAGRQSADLPAAARPIPPGAALPTRCDTPD
jgi:uncharacterized protein YfaS (alpha-2-macroglobulin family)